jgi:hypothetical protein
MQMNRLAHDGLVACVLLLCSAVVFGQNAAPKPPAPANAPVGFIWAEYGVATVIAGFDTDGVEVRHKIYAAVYGPTAGALGQPAADAAAACSPRLAMAMGYYLYQDKRHKDASGGSEALPLGLLDRIEVDTSVTGAEADGVYQDRTKARAVRLNELATELVKRLDATMADVCTNIPSEARPKFRPALTLRACRSDGSDSSCQSPALGYAWGNTATARRFSMIVEWISAMRPQQATQAPFALNNVVILGLADPAAINSAPKAPNAGSIATFFVDASQAAKWDSGGDLTSRQAAYEQAVLRARERGQRLEASVIRTWELPKQIAVHTADVLSGLPLVVGSLPDVPESSLGSISDEIARSRLRECVTYRGIDEISTLEQCAGYRITPVKLVECLGGRDCRPALDLAALPNAQAAALTIAARYDRETLAVGNLLPRVTTDVTGKISATIGDLEKKAAACLGPDGSASEKAAMDCLSRNLGADIYRKCLALPAQKLAECATNGPIPDDVARALRCVNAGDADPSCALALRLPAEVTKALRCAKDSQDPNSAARCALGAANPRVAELAQCLASESPDWSTCGKVVLGRDMPKEVAALAQCAATSSDYVAAAVCVANDDIPKDVRKAAQCLAQTGGDPAGTAVCMVSDDLNPYQQVALQCAVATGSEPNSFAVCAGGQLLVMRVQGCLRDDFGEGRCFGPNNDFQKLIKSIIGKDISPSSPVGQIITAQISVVRATVAFAGDVADEVERFAKNVERAYKDVERFTKRLGYSIEKDVKQTFRGIDKARRELLAAPGRALVDAVGSVGKRVERFVKKLTNW